MTRLRHAIAMLAMCSLVATSACYHFSWGPPEVERSAATAAARPAAILRVNEAGLLWGDGAFGERLRRTLGAQRFDPVHYPVEPVAPPSLVVEVEARGTFEPYQLWESIWLLASGFFYLPALVLPHAVDYVVHCEVRVLDGSEMLQTFETEDRVGIAFHMGTNPQSFVPGPRDRLLEHVAERIADTITATP